MCWLSQVATNWMGDDGFLKRLYGRLHLFNYVGDTTWIKGEVTAKRQEGDEYLVDIEIKAENQLKELTAGGTATVVLPARAAHAL